MSTIEQRSGSWSRSSSRGRELYFRLLFALRMRLDGRGA
jgi:hypothetical protein